jgi:hypothetical protein
MDEKSGNEIFRGPRDIYNEVPHVRYHESLIVAHWFMKLGSLHHLYHSILCQGPSTRSSTCLATYSIQRR